MEEALVNDDPNLLCGTVHCNVVVAIKLGKYKELAEHLKGEINLAWSKLARGRIVRRVCIGNTTIFLLAIDSSAREVGSILDEKNLDEALIETGVGRVATDPYEVRFALRMVERFGK